MRKFTWDQAFGWLGLALLAVGTYMGLFVAPPERFMGEVQRIMYVHVPCAWVGMVCYTLAFVMAIVSLWSHRPRHDAIVTAAAEVGIVLNALLLIQGSIWARATWGVWWDWDVRLTTSLVMLLLFAGVLALRSFVDDPSRRATWTAITTIVAFIDVPLVYFCVRWWRSLHQVQSSPETVDPLMVVPLRLNAFAILFIAIWMIARRTRLEMARFQQEHVDEPARLEPAGGGQNV
ncbi:MAG: cytochrome c biogenesis protein [Thermoanaerobaculia bacterium]